MQFNNELNQYQGKIRVRVCGLLFINNKLLLLKHDGIGKGGHLWSPPGGGMEYGEDAKSCLKREFQEEVNIEVEVCRFLFTNEYIDDKLHAIELFFEVKMISGEIKLGKDPEFTANQQILSELHFFDDLEIKELPFINKHNIFTHCDHILELLDLSGFYFFKNN